MPAERFEKEEASAPDEANAATAEESKDDGRADEEELGLPDPSSDEEK